MPPRGLKNTLKQTAPCKLVGSGFKKRFETVSGQGRGVALRGLTKRLQKCVFSDGELPAVAKASDARGPHWRGPGGGRRRGSAVDAQVSRLASASPQKRCNAKMLVLTRMVFAALQNNRLEPCMGQRAVCSQTHRVGTAADVLCYDDAKRRLVVVELKCGHAGCKTAAAVRDGRSCNMKGPLRRAKDCVLHRHLAQLSLTHHMLTRDARTVARLEAMGVEGVDGLLMYASDAGVETFPLVDWWKRKARALLDFVGS